MAQEDLKQKAFKGVFWSFCERFGSLLILFTTNIVLARILSPNEFGLIGILMAFVFFFNILIDGGLGNALVQRKNLTNDDCSTIFFTNIGVAVVCYIALFFGAGPIISFFNQPEYAVILLRVLGLIILIDAFSTVQNNILIRSLNFKRITLIKVGAAFISSSIAIISTFYGLGVWCLALQYILNSLLKSIFLWTSTNWYPTFTFNVQSFKELFGFGSKILMAGLLEEGYRLVQVLIIGKFYHAKEVGYFTQAKQLQAVPINTIFNIVNQVTFPIFAKLQDDKEQLIRGLSRGIKLLTFINFPLMIGLMVIAEPLFLLLYSDKWIEAVPYFQWLCGGWGLLIVVHNVNMNTLKAIGRSDTLLLLEIIKKVISFAFIFLFIWLDYGAISLIWALSINSFMELFLNAYYVGKYTGYGIIRQLKDIIPNLIAPIVAGIVAYIIPYAINLHYIIDLAIQIIVFCSLYLLISIMLKNDSYLFILNEVKMKIKNKKK